MKSETDLKAVKYYSFDRARDNTDAGKYVADTSMAYDRNSTDTEWRRNFLGAECFPRPREHRRRQLAAPGPGKVFQSPPC
jgi:hypothetical protein